MTVTRHRSPSRRASAQSSSRAAYWRALRIALGLRLEEIAEVSGFSLAYLSAIERGKRPLLSHVEDVVRIVLEREQRRVYEDAVRLEAA